MNYYDKNHQEFINNTINKDMSELYSIFLKDFKARGTILDLGCGPGRDLKYFNNNGYKAIGLEPSNELAEYARSHAKCEVLDVTIENYEPLDKFDGIWACASLLHLETPTLKEVLKKITSLMNEKSIFYCSFKYGDFEGERNGRFFNDQTFESLKELLPSNLLIEKHWITKDKRSNRENRWLNVLLRQC